MASSLSNASDENVFLVVTHSNLKNYRNEMKFSLRSTVATIKERLWRNCGTSIDHMLLQLFDENNQKISDLTDDSRPLGFYSPQDGYHMRIVDLDPSSVTAGGWLEDTSLVEKYHISEDAYEKRDGTFRKFKEKLIAQNPSIAQSKVGQRCEVDPAGKRGVVMFVGQAETLAPGYWIGVKYDEPVGKHNGMVKGKHYFSCPPLHGAMLRPDKIKVGDYPERDPFEDEEI